MADFKLGVSGSESDLPLCVADEMAAQADDSVASAEMLDGSSRYTFKANVVRTWPIEFNYLTATEVAALDALDALKQTLNYINGYQGLAAGVNVVISNWTGGTLITSTSGLTTPRYRGTLTLREVF